MACKNCKTNPVITLTNSKISLCKNCFIKYFEKKVLKTIRKFRLIDKKDNIAVAVSGGKDSLTVLHILNKLSKSMRGLKINAILIDEGIKKYRNITIKDAKAFCKKNKIPLHIYSYKKEFGYTLDQMVKKIDMNSCNLCGVLRRYLLNKKSRLLNANKLATGHNLDDEAQSILMNQFKNNQELSARLGPITGISRFKSFIPRIKPLYLLTEKETATYAFLKNFNNKYTECPYSKNGFRDDVRDFMNNFENKYRGSKNSLVLSFLSILPILKEKYKKGKIKYCKKCKEPCAKEICNACEILNKIKS
jgi:uncharacterized protein (TIGR00269 family)